MDDPKTEAVITPSENILDINTGPQKKNIFLEEGVDCKVTKERRLDRV